MKILPTLLAGILLSSAPTENPVIVNWKHLTDVRFSRKMNEELNMYFLYPRFGPTVKQLEGKMIQIRGYMIPADPDNHVYVLSAKPMSMCFFCGGAGPESIIELQFRDKSQRFKTDAVKTIAGKLALNSEDIEHLNYVLKDAVVIN